MENVYLVYYDNGAHYAEDRQVSLDKVFKNEKDAEDYVELMNDALSECEDDSFMGWEPCYFFNKAALL